MVKRPKKQKKIEVPFICLTNEPDESKINILQIFYQAVHQQQLGYMDGMDPDTGEIVPLLVGFDPTPDGQLRIMPLASVAVLKDHSKLRRYLVPDGRGNYEGSEAESGTTKQSQSPENGESTD